ncbi:HPP family protein [Chlamydoabsidia padenii]|nr:HPP family protein [Chlamydoabsidia padenii]
MISNWHLGSLPPSVSRWLGYRDSTRPLKTPPSYRICFWSFLGAWIGIALLAIIGTYSPQLHAYHSPLIIASFGASAVLLYGSIDAPLSQPRNAFFGHVIGALVGVIISKLFLQISTTMSDEQHAVVQWVAGATAVALAIVVMQLTVTVHPPGGATALIATVDDKVMAMGWYYIGIVAMSACLMIVVACLVNNIDRRYPAYWYRPTALPLKFDPANLATTNVE